MSSEVYKYKYFLKVISESWIIFDPTCFALENNLIQNEA